MHPKLDELRKRLLATDVPPGPVQYRSPARGAGIFSKVRDRVEELSSIHSGANETTVLNPLRTAALAEQRIAIEFTAPEAEPQDSEKPSSPNGLAQAVAELFEPARQCQGRLQEIKQASEAIGQLTRLAVELREPLKSFHNHIQKLSSSFESMRTFRDELGALAESFAPVRALHRQVIQLAQTVRGHLAEVADGLEPAKALKVEIADLGAAIDSVRELQARFYELSEGFGNAPEPEISPEATAPLVDSGSAQAK
jgi:uncharacterized coiled-coil DUF342 family protein